MSQLCASLRTFLAGRSARSSRSAVGGLPPVAHRRRVALSTARRLLAVSAASVFAVGLAGCADQQDSGSSEGEGGEPDPIQVGVVLDITGPGASVGIPERNTLQLLAFELNQDGGIDGREVELTILDNRSAQDESAKAMRRLVHKKKVDLVIGASRTGPSLAMRPIAERSKVPMISLAANAAIVDGSRWVFKTAQNDRVVVEKLVEYMAAKGWQTIGLARDASAFGEGVADLFNQVGKPEGLEVVVEEKLDPAATDFAAQMVGLRKADADVNVVWGIPPVAALAAKEYDRLGIKAPIMQSHGIGSEVFLDTAADSANGTLAASGRLLVVDQLPDDDPQKQLIEEFVDAYEDEYGHSPSTFAGHAYDAFQLAVEAFRAVGTDKQKVRDHLEQVSGLVGITGVYEMTPKDHSGLSSDALVMVKISDGDWVYLPDEQA